MTKRPHLATFTATLRAAEARPYDAEPSLSHIGGYPEPVPPPPRRRTVKTDEKAAVFIRVTPVSLAALHDLAEAEGISVQDLGVYALNLALAKFGREPVIESARRR